MTEADISAIAQLWVRASRAAGIELPWDEIGIALRQLPRPEAFAISDDAKALLMVGQSDALFTVSAEGGAVKLSSRPLNGDRLRVSLELREATLGTRITRWTFLYEGEPEPTERWQILSGSVSVDGGSGREDLDEREHFARTLAARAGWSEHESAPQPAPEPEEPEQREPRWRAMTDVWGQPVPKRGR